MAYLGSSPADRTTGARPRSEYLGDGVQYIYPLDQPVPGGFESNLLVVVDNVIQEPVEAYVISNLTVLNITNVTGTIVNSKFVRIGDARGIIVQATNSFLKVYKTSSQDFSTGTLIVSDTENGTQTASATISAVQTEENTALHFTGVPEVGQNVYAVHLGGLTYQSVPSAGSVTAESLATNLKAFTVDKFTSTSGQTIFNLSVAPASSQSIIVTANGSVYTDNVDFTLSGSTLTLAVGLSAGVKVTVFHLGFGTVSRNAFTDASVTTRALEDNAVKTAKIASQAVTAAKLATGVAVSNLGFTPVNKAGDTINGNLTVDNIILAQGANKGKITFPTSPNVSIDPYTLDDYREGSWSPVLQINGATTGITQTADAKYTKIGNVVFLVGTVTLTNKGALTGNVSVSGLPFVVDQIFNEQQFASVMVDQCQSVSGSVVGVLTPGSGSIALKMSGTGTRTDFTNSNLLNTSVLNFNFAFLTSD
jgi:hypothetical protein